MAEPGQNPTEKPVEIPAVAEAVAAKLLDPIFGSRIVKIGEQAIVEAIKTVLGAALRAAAEGGAVLAEGIIEAEAIADPAFQRLMAVAFRDITGIDLGGGAVGSGGRGGRTATARSLGGALFEAIAGTRGGVGAGGTLVPSQTGAEDYLTWVTQLALEGWLTGTLGEFVTLGQVEALGNLDDALADTLGLGRMSRRVVGPLLNAKVVTPFLWHVNRIYRPELLSAAETVRQVNRGRWARERGVEELARQGYSDDRIEALFNAQRKFFSVSDVNQFVTREHWTNERAIQHLTDNGYTEPEASDALRLEGLRRFESLENTEAGAIIGAYAARTIDRVTFTGLLTTYVGPQAERALWTELGDLRRELNVRRLSPAEARAAVKAKILSVVDYRRALEREGYPDEDVLVLELLLRHEMDEAADIEEARRQAAADREIERQVREAEKLRRREEVERERQQAQRGPLGPLEQAAVRGLIPIARVGEVYAFDYDADTVGILTELLEDRRLAYLDQLKRRDEAEQRAARRGLAIGELRAAVAAGVLSIAEFRSALEQQAVPPADVDVMARTLEAQLAARAAAQQARDQAAAEAKRRRIDLARFERLVRRGVRPMSQYEALLAEMGFDDVSIAAMRELVELAIADDARARQAREAAEARLRVKGLSLEQFRRGVLLGVKGQSDYHQFLMDQGFSVDAQTVLLAELRADLADADAARARRAAADASIGVRALPLSTVRRAAQLGIIPPQTYMDRRIADGYTEDDVAIDLEVLLVEIADVQQRREARDAQEQARTSRGLTLGEWRRAVLAGTATIADYATAAAAAGYTTEATRELVALLELEAEQQAAARARRQQIGDELGARALSLVQFEAALKAGFRSLDDYYAHVLTLGYASDDAELLTALVAGELDAAAEDGP